MPEQASAKPLGILGGTFDPVHCGHLRLAEEAVDTFGLAQVLWIPAGQPRLRGAPMAAPSARLEMVRLAITGNPRFAIDSAEVEAATPSYTVQTLERLRALHGPQRPLLLLLGADAFARLDFWHRWRDIFDLAHIAVATRPGHSLKLGAGEAALDHVYGSRIGRREDVATAPAGSIVPFAISALDISATALRACFGDGRSARYLAPDAVVDYIDRHFLYRSPAA